MSAENEKPRPLRELDAERDKVIAELPGVAAGLAHEGRPILAFINLWIAFNCLCAERFGDRAWRTVARLRGFPPSESVPASSISGRLDWTPEGARLRFESPLEMEIALTERYVESVIFSEFSKQYASKHEDECRSRADYCDARDQFLKAMTEHCVSTAGGLIEYVFGRSEMSPRRMRAANVSDPFVVDYLRLRQLWPERAEPSLDDLVRGGAIHVVRSGTLRELVRALYVIRCNIFHGSRATDADNSYLWLVPAAYRFLKHLFEMLRKDSPSVPPKNDLV